MSAESDKTTWPADSMPHGMRLAPCDWLKNLTSTTYTEQRDDRYVAALDLSDGNGEFTLAYVVRAVTPGEFTYPALVVEDMYEPETTGRTAMGKLSVQAR